MQNEQSETANADTLDIGLSDQDLIALVKQPIKESKSYWEKDFGLKDAREKNMNLWLPNHWKGEEYYDYQEGSLYADPRVFIATETITSNVNARVPQLEVMPAQDSIIALQAAKDMEKIGQAYTEKYDVLDLFRLSSRGLQIKRGGFIKLRWDPHKGPKGEIVSEFVQADDIIVDKDAKMGDIPRFLVHIIRNHTVEELIALLPDGEQEILATAGVQRRDKQGNLVAYKTQLSKKLDIYEIWFQYFEDGARHSGVMWTDTNLQHVFDKDRNPNWNYDAKDDRIANYLDEAAPPFIPINFLNDGSSYFDQTSLIEQAAPLQKIVDRRGFQIMENADQAGGGLVFNTQMISKPDMAKLVGSPDERIGVKGNVNNAITRVAPPPLPEYVIVDRGDARSEIDNVFSTHDITRGERSTNPTLGQDTLQQQGDMTRMDEIGRAVERQAKSYYRYLFQMMKVYYTEQHYFIANGEDGQFDFVVMHGDMIQNGADIRITAGSMRPQNKITQQKWISDLVQVGMIDPLSVFEVAAGGNLPSPKKMMERLILWKTNPMAFMSKVSDDDFSREALMDIQVLNGGEMPKVRAEYSDTYLKFINNYMMGGEFEKQSMATKALYIQYMRLVKMVIAQQIAKAMTQLPTQQELDAQNQQTAQQAALHGQIANAMPQPAQNPAGGPQMPQNGQMPQGGGAAGPGDQLAQRMAGAGPRPPM